MKGTPRFDILANGANPTSNDVLPAEQISSEALRSLFESAMFDFTVDDDGDIVVRDGYTVLVTGGKNRFVRLMSIFSFKPDISSEAKFHFCNRINDELVAIRASAHGPDSLVVDWYLPTDGGITKKAVVMGLRKFLKMLDLIARFDSDDLLM
jgi:hypothetical protein